MIIHILGASGSGVTTLGNYISKELGWKYLDSDDFSGRRHIHPIR